MVVQLHKKVGWRIQILSLQKYYRWHLLTNHMIPFMQCTFTFCIVQPGALTYYKAHSDIHKSSMSFKEDG